MLAVKQEAQQALTTIQDNVESSKVQTILGLLFFNQTNYMEAVNCFLQAKTLSPLSLCQLFLGKIPYDKLCNCTSMDRQDQPSI